MVETLGRGDKMRHDMAKLANQIAGSFGVKWHWRALSGGVPCVEMRLAATEYEHAKAYLTMLFGEPEIKMPWHPAHTKGLPPLRFKIEGATDAPDHVNLISMMQRPHKRYTLISYA